VLAVQVRKLPDEQVPRPKPLMLVPYRFVDEAVVEKRDVVVALVPVALTNVKFWRVEEPVSSRFESVVSPPVAVTVPVKLAADDIVWPLIRPEVSVPAVSVPILPDVEKRFVLEAVLEKKLVVVADVPVAVVN
jgi:hypothetical protein